ncbi:MULTISPECIES: OmpA family protein [unclassified Microbulbifer]|uniref:OmpA family protein n=1 Tax=unclassified Microbulbifer TaxID=2619833 RepID=UPI0027E43BCE|nr:MULTISPECIES: OmpA family protein [unclassified Microbulbifer]
MAFANPATRDISRAPPVPPAQQMPATDTPAQAANNPAWSQLATAEHESMDAGVADAAPVPSDASVPIPGGVGPPAPSGPDACSTQDEEDRKNAFRYSIKSVSRFRPSAGYGMFDATYIPFASLMTASVKMKFNFLPAEDMPDIWTLAQLIADGNTAEVAKYFWTEPQQRQYETDYVTQVASRWSLQHAFRSTKPCWPFVAHPVVYPSIVASDTDAHFNVNVFKMSSASASRKSTFRARNPGTADWQGSGELDENDVVDKQNHRSRDVARSERMRLERAISSTSASPILFEQGKSAIRPGEEVKLRALANLMKQKNPSDPVIPLLIDGFASAEGRAAFNQRLSEDRANAVRDLLQSEGVPQPAIPDGKGAVGAPNDPASRKVELTPDSSFETSYSGNVYAVAGHEFGHTLGLPDEYRNRTSGNLGQKQTDFTNLAHAAGVEPPDRWGDRTSSIMASGVDVLPRHYLTLWEALGAMTDPDITRDEWSVD